MSSDNAFTNLFRGTIETSKKLTPLLILVIFLTIIFSRNKPQGESLSNILESDLISAIEKEDLPTIETDTKNYLRTFLINYLNSNHFTQEDIDVILNLADDPESEIVIDFGVPPANKDNILYKVSFSLEEGLFLSVSELDKTWQSFTIFNSKGELIETKYYSLQYMTDLMNAILSIENSEISGLRISKDAKASWNQDPQVQFDGFKQEVISITKDGFNKTICFILTLTQTDISIGTSNKLLLINECVPPDGLVKVYNSLANSPLSKKTIKGIIKEILYSLGLNITPES